DEINYLTKPENLEHILGQLEAFLTTRRDLIQDPAQTPQTIVAAIRADLVANGNSFEIWNKHISPYISPVTFIGLTQGGVVIPTETEPPSVKPSRGPAWVTNLWESYVAWVEDNFPGSWLDRLNTQIIRKSIKSISPPSQSTVASRKMLEDEVNAIKEKYRALGKPEIADRIISEARKMLPEDLSLVERLIAFRLINGRENNPDARQADIISALDMIDVNAASLTETEAEIEEAIRISMAAKYGDDVQLSDDPMIDILRHNHRIFFVDEIVYEQVTGHPFGARYVGPADAIFISKAYLRAPKATRIAVVVHEAIHANHHAVGGRSKIEVNIPKYSVSVEEGLTVAAEDFIMEKTSYGVRTTKRANDQALSELLKQKVFSLVIEREGAEKGNFLIEEALFGNLVPLLESFGEGSETEGWKRLENIFDNFYGNSRLSQTQIESDRAADEKLAQELVDKVLGSCEIKTGFAPNGNSLLSRLFGAGEGHEENNDSKQHHKYSEQQVSDIKSFVHKFDPFLANIRLTDQQVTVDTTPTSIANQSGLSTKVKSGAATPIAKNTLPALSNILDNRFSWVSVKMGSRQTYNTPDNLSISKYNNRNNLFQSKNWILPFISQVYAADG
ncbi:MAG: hypothetical protein AAB874_08050, partial [Patescibacteria group bacterium]